MAGKSDTLEFALLQFLLQGKATNFPFGSTAGTTSLWLGLHTADPTDACSTAAEGGYTAYTRVLVDRSTAGWTVTSGTSAALATATPTTQVAFPQVATTSTGTFSFASIWSTSSVSSSGCLYFGTLSANINFSQNVTPIITTGSSITEE